MKLIFEQSHPGHRSQFLPASDVPAAALPEELARTSALDLPELTEGELARHYEALAQQVHGVNKGFYPLGSCTMKYNPRIDEDAAALPGFTGVHPLQSETTSRGCREVLRQAEERLTAITGMDRMTFQPAAESYLKVLAEATENPADMHSRPLTTYVRRLDEVTAARSPIVKYEAPTA